jgi:hypothetical protein
MQNLRQTCALLLNLMHCTLASSLVCAAAGVTYCVKVTANAPVPRNVTGTGPQSRLAGVSTLDLLMSARNASDNSSGEAACRPGCAAYVPGAIEFMRAQLQAAMRFLPWWLPTVARHSWQLLQCMQ